MAADNYKPTEKDWNHIKNVMNKYNRQSGWIDVIEDNNGNSKLEFFDSNPKINKCNALYITKNEVEIYSSK